MNEFEYVKKNLRDRYDWTMVLASEDIDDCENLRNKLGYGAILDFNDLEFSVEAVVRWDEMVFVGSNIISVPDE